MLRKQKKTGQDLFQKEVKKVKGLGLAGVWVHEEKGMKVIR